MLFEPYLKGATGIMVTDPYLRMFYQVRNFMEFLEVVAHCKPTEDEIDVRLITIEDDVNPEKQRKHLDRIVETSKSIEINLI